jgi:hypothetical protein
MSIKCPEPAFRISASTVRDRFAEISLNLAVLQHRANVAEAAARRGRQGVRLLTCCLVSLAVACAASLWTLQHSLADVAAMIEAAKPSILTTEILGAHKLRVDSIVANSITVMGTDGGSIQLGVSDTGPFLAMFDQREPGQKQTVGPKRIVLKAAGDAGASLTILSPNPVHPEKDGQFSIVMVDFTSGPVLVLNGPELGWGLGVSVSPLPNIGITNKKGVQVWGSPSIGETR